jgi:hypothetical protein
MNHPRRFTRVKPNGQMSSAAKIVIGPREPLVNCTVIDYAAGGACLEVFGQIVLPNRFELIWGVTKKKCRVIWKTGKRIGVAF